MAISSVNMRRGQWANVNINQSQGICILYTHIVREWELLPKALVQ